MKIKKSVSEDKPGICLVGLGPHAKRIYYNYIEQDVLDKKLDFYLLIDLTTKEADIDDFCAKRKVQPQNIFLSKVSQIFQQTSDEKLDPRLVVFLDKAIREKRIQYAVVSTEPRAHKVYIEYFIKNKIPVLTDKPLTSPVGVNYKIKKVKQISADAKYLSVLSSKYDTPIYVQVQRREHPAYKFIFNEVKKVIDEYQVPITFFNVYHSDGQWTMPSEFASRENHPHKYGYGKIMHSGYHFADLVAWIAESNKRLFPNLYISNETQLLLPGTHYGQIKGARLYKKIFGKKTLSPKNEKMGEVDSYTSFVFRDSSRSSDKNNMITFGNLNMLQSGFSKRAWFPLPVDTYKGNGRLRHEYFDINIGPLFNIQFHSYQSEEVHGGGPTSGVGSRDHLEVYIFRNEKIIGGKPFEIVDFSSRQYMKDHHLSSYLGHNEEARHMLYGKMFSGSESPALIQNQILTNNIIAHLYESSIRKKMITFDAS